MPTSLLPARVAISPDVLFQELESEATIHYDLSGLIAQLVEDNLMTVQT